MEIKNYILLLFTLFVFSNLFSQVGIGNTSPDSTSVLDLSNTNNRGLLLPSTATASAMTSSNKAIYFFSNYIYFKTSLGYNTLSPWKYKFNGDTTNNLYYDLSGNIGIGNADITIAPEAPLQIETDIDIDLDSNGSLLLGKSSSKNMAINPTEIQTRNAGVGSELKINEDGGNVTFGDATMPVDVNVSGKVQELDDATNSYYDLVPPGLITAWFGYSTNIPTGWAICDGGTYDNSNGIGTVTTPNLSGRFIVSVGDNGVDNYNLGDTGGVDLETLTIAEMPSHSHNARITGSHNHGYFYDEITEDNDVSDTKTSDVVNEKSNISYHYNSTNIGYANIHEDDGGSGQAHENRPVYYSLVFIIKL